MDVFYEKHTEMASAIIRLCRYKCHDIRIDPHSQKSQNTSYHPGEIPNLQSFIYAGNFARAGWAKSPGICDASKIPCMVNVCRRTPGHGRAEGAAPQPADTGYLCQKLANKLLATSFRDHPWKHILCPMASLWLLLDLSQAKRHRGWQKQTLKSYLNPCKPRSKSGLGIDWDLGRKLVFYRADLLDSYFSFITCQQNQNISQKCRSKEPVHTSFLSLSDIVEESCYRSPGAQAWDSHICHRG